MSYSLLTSNGSYTIETYGSKSVRIPYYAGYADQSNNINGNVGKLGPIDLSIHYISGSNWLTYSTGAVDDTAAYIQVTCTSATSDREARIYLKDQSNNKSTLYVTIKQIKPTSVYFYWKSAPSKTTIPYNAIWHSTQYYSKYLLINPYVNMNSANISFKFLDHNDGNSISNKLYQFTFELQADNKYYFSSSSSGIDIIINVEGDGEESFNVSYIGAVEINEFFDVINGGRMSYFEYTSSCSSSQWYFNQTGNRPYGIFNMSIDSVINGYYTPENPYICDE